MAEGPAQTVPTGAGCGPKSSGADTRCASGPSGRPLAARKALWRFCRGRTAAMRYAREDRPQCKNDTVPGGTAARDKQAVGLPRRTGDKGGVTGLSWHTTFGAWPTRSEAAPAGRLPTHCTKAESEPPTHAYHQRSHGTALLGRGSPKVWSFATGQGLGWPWSKTPACRRARPGGAQGKR